MSQDDDIRQEVLIRWAARLTNALPPLKYGQAREFVTRVDIDGPKAATDWIVSVAPLTEADILEAISDISTRVMAELEKLADFSDEPEEVDDVSKKFFDMGENFGSLSPISMLASDHLQNHFPPEHINSRCVIEGNPGNRLSGVGHVTPTLHLKKPEDIGGAGSEKVLMIHPATLNQLNHTTSNELNSERGQIKRLHGFKVHVSPSIKEGEIFVVSPQPLTTLEADSIDSLKGHISRLVNLGTPPPTPSVFSVGGTKFRPGDVMDELVGDRKEPEDDREVKEKRRRVGDRRLRDAERQDDD